MANKSQYIAALILGGMLICADVAFATKSTDLMYDALKQRSIGNISAAIKGFKKACDAATLPSQKNLALFMLGDCQLEVKNYTDAVRTFRTLSKSVNTVDEHAEALYKLMEGYKGLGKNDRVSQYYAELKKKYRKSTYFPIAEAFMKAGNIEEIDYDEIIAEDSENTSESVQETVEVAKSESKTESKPAKKETKKVEAKPEKQTVKTSKTDVSANKNEPKAKKTASKPANDLKQLDSKTTAILNSILPPESVSDSEKDNLVSKILGYQDQLKDGETGPGKDKILFDLAQATERFGETLEACKCYDKILSLHPNSSLTEQAYYEAIRLRAKLGIHPAVVEWANAYLAAFPKSANAEKVKALSAYSKLGGKVKLASAATGGRNSSASAAGGSGSAGKSSPNDSLKSSSIYQKASQKMKNGEYASALDELKELALKYPDSSQLWWDTTLVYVQLEQFNDADKSIRKMLLLDPDNEDANSLMGYIQYRLENYEEAANAYEQAGEASGKGVTFFDAKSASERMKKNSAQ